MKKVIAIFEIPDDEFINNNFTPKINHVRISSSGSDVFCNTSVKIIDCPESIEDIIESELKNNIIKEDDYFIIEGNKIVDVTDKGKTYKDLIIPKGITEINKHAFACCKSLEHIIIPDTVTNIGDGAFYNCINLKIGVIPKGIIYINSNTFFGCENLESLVMYKKVKSIGYSAFYGCTNLRKIHYIGTKDEWNLINIFPFNDELSKANIFYC